MQGLFLFGSQVGSYLYKVIVQEKAKGSPRMSQNQLYIHRSEQYIYYYRRAIPEFLRPTFNNKWKINKPLRTRDKPLAILRHNQINLAIEQIVFTAKVGHSSQWSA